MRLILHRCGEAPCPDMTPEESRAAALWLADYFRGQWLELGADPADVARYMLDRFRSPQN